MCAQNGRGLKICNYLEYTFRLRMLLEVTRSTVWQQCTRGKVTYQGDLMRVHREIVIGGEGICNL